MESHNICDYSFLVGFHFVNKHEPLPEDYAPMDPSVFRQDYGGMFSSDKTEIYYVAIIDNLTEYDLKKMGEGFLKSLRYQWAKISAISPSPYRKRFQKAIASIVV